MSYFGREINRILTRIQKGDERYQEVLFEKTYNHLKAIARQYLRDKNDIEDVLSTAYLKAFQSIASFDNSKDGYNWLCKIVQNIAFDFNKKAMDYLPIEEGILPMQNADFQEIFSQNDEIYRLLSECDEEDKRLVYLKFWEDLSYTEIAQRTGSKKSTVHKRISKILKEICKKIDQRVDD